MEGPAMEDGTNVAVMEDGTNLAIIEDDRIFLQVQEKKKQAITMDYAAILMEITVILFKFKKERKNSCHGR